MERSKLIKKIDNQIYFRIFVAVLWSKEILLNYFRGFLMKVPVLSAVSDYIIPAILFLLFLLSYKTIAERLRGADFVFVMACILVYLGNYLFVRRSRDFFRVEWVNFLIGSLPFYFVGVALRSDDEGSILKLLYRISCVSVVAFCIYILFINQMDEETMRDGDMSSAYNLLPHACLTFYYMIKEFKWHRPIFFLVAAIALFMMGTRGAVLCLFVFIVLCSAVTIQFKRPIVLLSMGLVCVLLVIFPQILDWLIETAYSISESLGLSTRVFDKLMEGNFAVSDARVYLRERVRHYILAYPIVGLGIYGDRVVSNGQYVHNLILELYANFGILMGTILVTALTVLSYRSIRYVHGNREEHGQLILLLLFGYCFKLLVSSSYLREPFFWLLIGYLVGVVRESRMKEGSERVPVKKSRLIK